MPMLDYTAPIKPDRCCLTADVRSPAYGMDFEFLSLADRTLLPHDWANSE